MPDSFQRRQANRDERFVLLKEEGGGRYTALPMRMKLRIRSCYGFGHDQSSSACTKR